MKLSEVLKILAICYLGSLMFAISVNGFLIPNGLGEGGVTGVTFILYYMYEIPTAYTNLILNGVLLILGYKFLDRKTMIYTVITVIMLSWNLHITEKIPQITENIWIAITVGGILTGLGLGAIIKVGSTTAGTTILAKLMEKYFKWRVSYSLLLTDIIVVVFGIKVIGVENTIYTVLMLVICAKIMDIMLKEKQKNKVNA